MHRVTLVPIHLHIVFLHQTGMNHIQKVLQDIQDQENNLKPQVEKGKLLQHHPGIPEADGSGGALARIPTRHIATVKSYN